MPAEDWMAVTKKRVDENGKNVEVKVLRIKPQKDNAEVNVDTDVDIEAVLMSTLTPMLTLKLTLTSMLASASSLLSTLTLPWC